MLRRRRDCRPFASAPLPQQIIFDHRQKTAGTSLRAVCCGAVGEDRVSPLMLEGTMVLASRLLDRFDVVFGHFTLPPEYDFPREVYHLTLLRDPIDRFLSHVSSLREVDDNDPVSVYLNWSNQFGPRSLD